MRSQVPRVYDANRGRSALRPSPVHFAFRDFDHVGTRDSRVPTRGFDRRTKIQDIWIKIRILI